MTNQRLQLGKKGEQLVADYLKKQGYTICCMNYTQRCGEIDIIAEKKEVRAFVEVKLRRTNYFATSQVVTPAKQKKIGLTARHYNYQQSDNQEKVLRFDVALVEPNGDDYTITYIPNAFAPNAFTPESSWL
jgi:putative endonuclease